MFAVLRFALRDNCRLIYAVPLTLLAVTGCVNTSGFTLFHPEVPEERPVRIDCIWERQLRIALDTEKQGAQVPMLACRVYFVGADGRPMTVHGRVMMYWYDAPGGPNAPRPPLGYCEYDSVTLQKMKRDDHVIGLGYSLVASWDTFEPKYNRIWAHVCFVPDKGGAPIYASPQEISLHGDDPVTSDRPVTVPVSALPPAKALSQVDPFGMGPRTPVTSVWNSPR